MTATKILILDDESIIRESLADFFEDQGWLPLGAESAERALELLADQTVKAAIVDIRLPGMDGVEFLRKATVLYPDMAFLVCTGSVAFSIPADLCDNPNVSSWLCRKPVRDLDELHSQLLYTVNSRRA